MSEVKQMWIMTLVGYVYFQDAVGNNSVKAFFLDDYKPNKENTAYQLFREDVLDFYRRCENPFRIELALSIVTPRLSNGKREVQTILYMKGDDEWMEGVEFYNKYIGVMGGSGELESVGMGLLDTVNEIRAEFSEGVCFVEKVKMN